VSTRGKSGQQGSQLIWLGGAAIYYLFIRPQLRKWGTELGEPQRRLPGDDVIPAPNFDVTHAINIDAPPEAVWPWIAQMGRERTGFYGLDMLTNQCIPSVNFIRKDLEALQVGQAIDGGYQVLDVEPNRKLLFGGFGLARWGGATQDMSVLYLLERRSDGSTRLLIRRRAFTYGLAGAAYNLGYEAVYGLFVWQQMGRLKHYSEHMSHVWLRDR
jgi:hypothetical protein